MNQRILFFLLLLISASSAKAQLNENFNTTCPAGAHSPTSWHYYNPVTGTVPAGVWTCDPTYGRGGTPGISCTGFYGSPATLHNDTSILISPALALSSYSGNLYVNFDTKATKIFLGAKLDVMVANNDTFGFSGLDTTYTITASAMPVIGNPDSSDWVTHQVDITSFKHMTPLFIGFRYTSTTTTVTASRWFLDNISITGTPMQITTTIETAPIPLSLTANATRSRIALSYEVEAAGAYDLAIYDIMGREVKRERIQAAGGPSQHIISGLDLHTGMYILKMSNGTAQGVAKVMVQ